MKKWIVIALLLVLWFAVGRTLPVYHYESSDRGWSDIEVPWKGRHFAGVEKGFEDYRRAQSNADVKLHRTSGRIWAAPNLWWDNLTHRRWDLPYMEPSPKPAD